jgi:hypothetical protein
MNPFTLINALSSAIPSPLIFKHRSRDRSWCFIEVSGTWTGTVNILGSIYDGGADAILQVFPIASDTPQTDITANGLYKFEATGLWDITGDVAVWTSGTSVTVKLVTAQNDRI